MDFYGFPCWTAVSKLTTVQEVGLGHARVLCSVLNPPMLTIEQTAARTPLFWESTTPRQPQFEEHVEGVVVAVLQVLLQPLIWLVLPVEGGL